MIGFVRIHAYRAGIFQLIDVPISEAKRRRLELLAEGYTITHTETI